MKAIQSHLCGDKGEGEDFVEPLFSVQHGPTEASPSHFPGILQIIEEDVREPANFAVEKR